MSLPDDPVTTLVDSRPAALRPLRGLAVLLAGLMAASVLVAEAAAAPLSCPVGQLEELGAGRGLGAAVATAGRDGAVVWSPTDASTGALSARRLRNGVVVGREHTLAGPGRARGLRVLATPGGDTVLVFQRIRGDGPQAVMAASLTRDGFTPPATLSRFHASLPDASIAPDGTVRAVWIEAVALVGYQIVTATRSPDGAWSAPATVASEPASNRIDDVKVLAGPAGRAVIAWRSSARRGVKVLRLGAGGAAEIAPITLRDGAMTIPRLALGGSPSGALVAWIDLEAPGIGRAVAVHLPFEGDPGTARTVSRSGETVRELLITSGRARLGLVAWTAREAGRRIVRISRLDTSTGELAPWVSAPVASEQGVAVAVSEGGRGAAAWRARLDGRPATRIVAGPLDRERPADSGAITQPRAGLAAPSLAVASTGPVPVALGDPAGSFRVALRLATCRPAAAGTGVTLTAAQLRINQRIAQAAVRRINALTAMVDGLPAPNPGAGDTSARVTLSTEQLRINQRISQAAVRRANALAGRLEGILPLGSAPQRPGGNVTLSARQLLINQRISQAAVRRANALADRVPDLPHPPPGLNAPELSRLVGNLETADRAVMTVRAVERRGTLDDGIGIAPGDRLPVVFSGPGRPAIGAGSVLGVVGVVHGAVVYGMYWSIEPPRDPRSAVDTSAGPEVLPRGARKET